MKAKTAAWSSRPSSAALADLTRPDLVVVGHICRDVVSEPPYWRPGGAVFYAASTAARLGCSVGVITAGADEVEVLRALPNTTVINLEAKCSTSYENLYESGGRTQYLRALAPPISPDLVPPEWAHAPVALLAPVADEVPPAMARLFPHALLGVAPQGYMRQLAVGQKVRYKPWDRAAEILSRAAVAVFSEEDIRGHAASWLGFPGPVLVMTRGPHGCELIHNGKHRQVAGFPVDEVDPTGAGDVFFAAFMLKLREVREPLEAARFANAVASFSVTGPGTAALPDMEQALDRLGAASAS